MSNQSKVLEKIHEDLKLKCFGMAVTCKGYLQQRSLNGPITEDVQSVYVDAMFEILWAHAHMQLQYGLYMNSYNTDTITVKNGDYVFQKIDTVINMLDKLEAKHTGYHVEQRLEELKANLISAIEYDGTWEALYTTEERPF